MKKITLLFLFLTLNATSQSEKLKNVDKVILSYSNSTSIEELAKRIDYDFKSDIEKARAVYSWVASNVLYKVKNRYEITSLPKIYVVTDENDLKRRLQKEDKKTVSKVFQNRRAVCKGYALLFKELCDLLKIECDVVLGYIKNSTQQIGFIPKQKNHAWNVVKIDGEWIFLDVTFGAGYANNNIWHQKFNPNYFNINKEVLRHTHYAKESYWREHVNQFTLKEFSTLPLYSNGFFNNVFEVVSPKNGIIKIDHQSKFELKIKGMENTTKIHYRFGQNGRLMSPSVKHDGLVSTIKIRKPKKNTILKIYFDKELALEYLAVAE